MGTEQAQVASKDPVKQLEYQTGKIFAEQLKGMAQLHPQERQMAMRNAWAQREQVLSEARFEQFNTKLAEVMATTNWNDPASAHLAKVSLVALGKKAGVDSNAVLRALEPKAPVHFPAGSMVQQPDGSYKQIGTPSSLVNPPISFNPTIQKDENGREYQLDSRGQRHYAPALPQGKQDAALERYYQNQLNAYQKWITGKPHKDADYNDVPHTAENYPGDYQSYLDAKKHFENKTSGANPVAPTSTPIPADKIEEAKRMVAEGVPIEEARRRLGL
jgi:hypothetical protein